MRGDGALTAAFEKRRRMSAATAALGSPEAHRRSASRRSSGHAYEPGSVGVGPRRTASSSARSAASRRFVKQPAALHTYDRLTTRSLPPRLATNSGLRWYPHSHTRTPFGR